MYAHNVVAARGDAEALEGVDASEYRARRSALFGKPEGHTVAVKISISVDLEFNFNLLAPVLATCPSAFAD